MPGLASDQATLDEILEVRAKPLNEPEIWGVLLESGNALKSVLSKTPQERLLHLALTLRPDTLLLCLNGRIKFAITKHAKANKHFIAPESFHGEGKCNLSKIEKMLVYCLGMTTLAAAENGIDTNTELNLSSKLENLLYSMVEDSCSRRCSVSEIIQICSRNIDIEECYSQIRKLAVEIVGPYGLLPLSKFPSLPDPPTSKRDQYNPSVAPLTPVSSLPPVGGRRNKSRSMDFTDADYEHSKATRKPPAFKASLAPRNVKRLKREDPAREAAIDNGAWSPSVSSPDLMMLMDLENEKLKSGGYLREQPRMLFSPNKSLSMPSLNDVDDESSETPYDSKAEKPFSNSGYKSKPHYHSVGYIHDRGGSITSQNSSSQMSLTHGAYVLDSDPLAWSQEFPMMRSISGSSVTQMSIPGSQTTNFQLPLRPPGNLDLANLGPEFVRVVDDPDQAVVDISPPRLGPLPKGTRKININLPNNQQIQTTVQVSSKVKDVFDKIVEHISLKETTYFGLTQVKDGEEMFLELDSKLNKYAPTGWKDENVKKQKVEFVLFFRVKYFIEDPRMLKHCLTIHLYYLQLRQFLLSGYLQCPDDVLINMTSYALQAEYGDFLPEYQGVEYFKKEFYIPGKILSRLNRADLLRNLPRLHQSRCGLSQEEAELAFLEDAAALPEYGIIFHKVSRSKKNESDYVWLGIQIKGIIVLEQRGLQRTAVHKQTWDLIKEFTFDKKKFTLKPKKPDESPKLVFYTNHYRKSKYLFKLCQFFHRFQIYNETRKNRYVPKRNSAYSNGNQLEKNTKIPGKTPHDVSMSERKVILIHLKKEPNQSLGLVIVGGDDSKRLTQGIFIKHIKQNSVCEKDGRLNEGDKIISVNGTSLEEATHEQGAQVLKKAGNELQLVISKASTNVSLLEKSGLSPGMDNSHVQKYKNWDSMLGENEELKKKLSGIDLVDDEESDGQYSERAIDVPDGGTVNHVPPSSEYDNPADLDRTMDDVVDKLLRHDNVSETPRANVIVNDIEVNHDNDDEEDTSLLTTSDHHSSCIGQSNLKRFGAFESLDKLNDDDDDEVAERDNGGGESQMKADYDGDRSKMGVDYDGDSQLEEGDFSQASSPDIQTERSLANRTLDQTIDEVDVELVKINSSFGFSVQGGKESNLPLGSIYVKHVYPGGAAALTKKIKGGDRILAVNGISLEDISHHEAVDILRRAPDRSVITLDHGIEISDSEATPPPPPLQPPANPEIEKMKNDEKVFEVVIEKRDNGLGVSLAGGKGSDICYKGKLMIRKLFSGHAMFDSGRFLVGDLLLAVNDQIVEGMTYQEAISVIRSSPQTVTIIARRPTRDEIPSELFKTSRPVSPEKLLKDSKHLQLSGRSSSREGHRLAKELLQSLKDVDEDSMDIPLSSVIAHSQIEEGTNSDDDIDAELPEDLDAIVMDAASVSDSRKEDSVRADSSKSLSFDTKQVADKMNELMDNRKDRGSGNYEQESDFSQSDENESSLVEPVDDLPKIDGGEVAGNTDTESSSFIGVPRRRPIQKQEPVEEQNIEMEMKEKYLPQQEKKVIEETEFTVQEEATQNAENNAMFSPRHQPSPLLYPSSPGALKNLNAVSQSPSKQPMVNRRCSTGSRASSTGEIISIQLDKGDKGLGITLATNLEGPEPFVYIKRLVPGSVADGNGRLKDGDRIVTVNGRNVEDLPQKEIIGIFRQLSGTVFMEFYRSPELSPTHKLYQSSDDNASLTLPPAPSATPKNEEIIQSGQPVKESVLLKNMDSLAPTSSTPNDFSDKGLSEDITFNSNDGLSFADSLIDSDQEEDAAIPPLPPSGFRQDPALLLPSPPALAQPYEGDSDSESIQTQPSAMENLNELGIYIVPPKEEQQVLPAFNKDVGQRPPSGASGTPTTVRRSNSSGIPRPIRSRSNSLASEGSSSLSRRSSSDGASSSIPPPPRHIDKSTDGFIDRKKFVFYTPDVVKNVVVGLEKKMETTKLNAEFMALRQIKCLDSCDAANRASNRPKNRVKTVLPYDKNRVQLTGSEESDYINASLIKLPIGKQKTSQYIVTQAPLETTVCDFWRCIWEKKVEVIVMLTREEENGKMKCHKYWPSVKKTPMKLLDKFTVELLYEEFNGSFIYRQIQIHNIKLGKSLFITQAAYTQWPETGVPKDSIDFLGFIKFVRHFSSSAITLVHCSAGVGRSGIYVTVDNIWSSIEEDVKVDVAKIIQQAKEQRQILIQTKEQYGFIYQTVKELFQDLHGHLDN